MNKRKVKFNKIPLSEVNKRLIYDRETGIFLNKRKMTVAGHLHKSGYIIIYLNGKLLKAHRIAMAIILNDENIESDIDHINGIKTDNSEKNLRLCTDLENLQNIRKSHRDSRLGVIGVHYNKNKVKRKYRAAICIKGKQIRKSFLTLDEAKEWYLNMKRENHPFSTI